MTDAERDRLAGYLRILADRMGLKDWHFDVLAEPATEGVYAEVCCPEGRKLARLRFDDGWPSRTPETLRQTCCHELLHCHHAAVRAEAERRFAPATFATFEMLLEYAIDGIADAWAPCLPLMLMAEAHPEKGGVP